MKAAKKIADGLDYSPLERAALLEATLRESGAPADALIDLREEEFQLVSDWYHFAILGLAELPHHRADPRWIARQLGIGVTEAAEGLARLERLGIAEAKNGRLRQLMKPLRTTTDVPSAAIRQYHRQNLDNARDRLEQVPVQDRDYSAITMAIARRNLPKAKKLIAEFKRKLCALLEDGEKEAVYTLAIQLFPVSKLEEK